jgi:hypothetical protein
MLGPVEHPVDRAFLDDEAAMEHVYAVDDLSHDGEVVRDEQVREPELLAQRAEQVQDLCLNRDVERRHGLVADDQLRLDRERARDRDSLSLAPRQRSRTAPHVAERQADTGEELVHARVGAIAGVAVDAEYLPERRPDRLRRVECRVRILEDDLHRAPELPAILAGELRVVARIHTADRDRPAGRRLEPDEAAAQSRLPRARLSDDADRLALCNRERDVGDGRSARVGEDLAQVGDRDERQDRVLDGFRRLGYRADLMADHVHLAPDLGDPQTRREPVGLHLHE